MNDLTERERALRDHLETGAYRMSILCAMLDLFEESSPFSDDSALLNPQAREAHRLRALLFLNGLHDLAEAYHRDLSAVVAAQYQAAIQKDRPILP